MACNHCASKLGVNVHCFLFFYYSSSPCIFTLFILERVDGGELFDRIIKKKFYNEKEARDLAVVILKALKHCHDHKIAHRYVQAGNFVGFFKVTMDAVFTIYSSTCCNVTFLFNFSTDHKNCPYTET